MMDRSLHTIVETPPYLRDAAAFGLSEDERTEIVSVVAERPDWGDEIIGAGGVRKFRFAGRGKGKSGGYRITSFYAGENVPVYLLAILSKGERANFSAAEVNAFRQFADGIKKQWRTRLK